MFNLSLTVDFVEKNHIRVELKLRFLVWNFTHIFDLK